MKKRITKLTVPLEKAEKVIRTFASLAGARNFSWLELPTPENALNLVKEGYSADTWEYKVGSTVCAGGQIITPSGICLSVSKRGLNVDFRRPSLVCASDVAAAAAAASISGDDIIAYLEGGDDVKGVEDLLQKLDAELTPAE